MDGRFEDTDEDSDWDRYSYGDEDENYSSGGTGSGRNLPSSGKQSGQLDVRHSSRVQETSIFGLTDKRRPEPLRSVLLASEMKYYHLFFPSKISRGRAKANK